MIAYSGYWRLRWWAPFFPGNSLGILAAFGSAWLMVDWPRLIMVGLWRLQCLDTVGQWWIINSQPWSGRFFSPHCFHRGWVHQPATGIWDTTNWKDNRGSHQLVFAAHWEVSSTGWLLVEHDRWITGVGWLLWESPIAIFQATLCHEFESVGTRWLLWRNVTNWLPGNPHQWCCQRWWLMGIVGGHLLQWNNVKHYHSLLTLIRLHTLHDLLISC